MPAAYDDAVRLFTRLTERLDWLEPRLVTTPGGGGLAGVPLAALQERLAGLAERGESLAIRPKVVGLMDTLQEAGLGALVEDLATRTVHPDLVGSELDLVWWTSVLGRVAALDARYAGHDGAALREAARAFARADNAVREGQAARLRVDLTERVRAATAAHPEQVAELRAWAGVSPGEHGGALMARPRVALPVARLLSRCRDLVTAIAPCWAMSPLVTTSVLPPDAEVDVVLVAQGQRRGPGPDGVRDRPREFAARRRRPASARRARRGSVVDRPGPQPPADGDPARDLPAGVGPARGARRRDDRPPRRAPDRR